MAAENNSDLLIQQHSERPNIVALIDRIDEIIQNELCDAATELETQFSVLTATGVWLDRIGERFGLPRPFLAADEITTFGFDSNGTGFDQQPFTDETDDTGVPVADSFYRQLIIARGGQLITDGSVPSMDAILQAAFGDGHYIDNMDMTMAVRIDGDRRQDQIDLIIDTRLITKPSGVRLSILYNVHTGGSFGFDNNGTGFDQQPFVNTNFLEQ